MKSLRPLSLIVAMTLVLAFSVAAQQQPETGQQQQQMQGMQGMHGQMHGMMQDCHKNMQKMMQSNEQTRKDIQAAKASNDAAKMRAALDEADKALGSMQDHMSNCMSMMDKHGMMSEHEKSESPKSDPPQR